MGPFSVWSGHQDSNVCILPMIRCSGTVLRMVDTPPLYPRCWSTCRGGERTEQLLVRAGTAQQEPDAAGIAQHHRTDPQQGQADAIRAGRGECRVSQYQATQNPWECQNLRVSLLREFAPPWGALKNFLHSNISIVPLSFIVSVSLSGSRNRSKPGTDPESESRILVSPHSSNYRDSST